MYLANTDSLKFSEWQWQSPTVVCLPSSHTPPFTQASPSPLTHRVQRRRRWQLITPAVSPQRCKRSSHCGVLLGLTFTGTRH